MGLQGMVFHKSVFIFFYIGNAQVTAEERYIIDQIQHKGVITSPEDKMAQPETRNLHILGMFNLIYTNFVYCFSAHSNICHGFNKLFNDRYIIFCNWIYLIL